MLTGVISTTRNVHIPELKLLAYASVKIDQHLQFVAVAIAAERVRIASGEYSAGTVSKSVSKAVFLKNISGNIGTHKARE
jgi:hypothetical protein